MPCATRVLGVRAKQGYAFPPRPGPLSIGSGASSEGRNSTSTTAWSQFSSERSGLSVSLSGEFGAAPIRRSPFCTQAEYFQSTLRDGYRHASG